MQILLFILKLFLIILLVAFGIVLFSMALVLFVPVRYEVNGEIRDEFQIEVGGTIKYLLSIFKFVFCYREDTFSSDIYIFGRQKKKMPDDVEAANTDESEPARESEAASESEIISESKTVYEPENDIISEHTEKSETVTGTEMEGEPEIVDETAIQKKTAVGKKSEVKNEKRRDKSDKKEKSGKIDYAFIKQELTDEHNHNVLKKIFKELKYLLHHFGFRKIETDLRFGMGDPALTGQLLGVLSVFPFLYRYQFQIVPDFETDEAYVKGTFYIGGRVRLVHILITVLRLLFDKEVRTVIKKFVNMLNQ